MMEIKRLFLFAGYDKDGIIDETLLHYLRCLSQLGDIVFVMDSNATPTELNKVKDIPNVLYAVATRHGEYDFGSYKRAYMWADEQGILNNYDWVYLVNDSVYGPLFDVKPVLLDLESRGVDLVGMTDYQDRRTLPHIQSWFVGMTRRVATADFMREFMAGIHRETEKALIVLRYEVGLSQTVLRHGYKMSTIIAGQNGDVCHALYACPTHALHANVPFIKKAGLQNLGGLLYLYQYTTEKFADAIKQNATRTKLPITTARTEASEPRYRKYYRLTIWSVPLLTIYRQKQDNISLVCYKSYLFDIIPLCKIFRKFN